LAPVTQAGPGPTGRGETEPAPSVLIVLIGPIRTTNNVEGPCLTAPGRPLGFLSGRAAAGPV